MLYSFGPLSVQVYPFNVDAISESAEADFAIKPVAGAPQPLEFVGDGGNELTLSGQLFPAALGGLDELDLLGQMRAAGKPQYLMRGDGRPMGWFAILDVTTRSRFLDGHGIGKQIAITIRLRRAPTPPAQSFFSLIAGLLG